MNYTSPAPSLSAHPGNPSPGQDYLIQSSYQWCLRSAHSIDRDIDMEVMQLAFHGSL